MKTACFAYHRAVAPMLWVLIALSTVELLVVHFLLALWHPWGAALVSLPSLAIIAWLVWFIGSLRAYPVIVSEHEVLMRIGRLKRLAIPRARIVGIETDLPPGGIRRPDLLNLGLLAYPNVILALAPPVERKGWRGVRVFRLVGHRLDDAPAFIAALGALEPRDDRD